MHLFSFVFGVLHLFSFSVYHHRALSGGTCDSCSLGNWMQTSISGIFMMIILVFLFLNHYHYTITHLAEHVSVVKYFSFTGAYNGQSADCCSHFYICTTACTVDLYAVVNPINSVNFLHHLGR